MKRISLILFTLCIFVSCKKEEQGTLQVPDQLFRNTDLESDPNGAPWEIPFGPKYDFIINCTEEDSFSPTHSLKIARTEVDTTNFFFWTQSYSGAIPVGDPLILTAKVKGVSLDGAGVILVIRCDGALSDMIHFVTTEGIHNISGTFDWTTYTLSIPELSEDVKHIYVYLVYLPYTTGTVYFDDITLTHK